MLAVEGKRGGDQAIRVDDYPHHVGRHLGAGGQHDPRTQAPGDPAQVNFVAPCFTVLTRFRCTMEVLAYIRR